MGSLAPKPIDPGQKNPLPGVAGTVTRTLANLASVLRPVRTKPHRPEQTPIHLGDRAEVLPVTTRTSITVQDWKGGTERVPEMQHRAMKEST